MEPDVRRGRSVVFTLSVHLVFVTKYRRGVITARVRARLREYLEQCCRAMNAELRECDGEDDHLHLLVDYPPKLSISKMVNALKLASSRRIRSANLPEVRRKLWGNQFWTPSYYAGSCGSASLRTVKAYIQAQRSPTRHGRR